MSLSRNVLSIPAVDGTVLRSVNFLGFNHHIGVTTDAVATGTLEIKARPPGSEVFEVIEGAEALDLAALESVQVTGVIEEYQLTLASATGATTITITDTVEVS